MPRPSSHRAFLRAYPHGICSAAVAGLIVLGAPRAHAFDAARNAYLMRCGGCHGIEGVSVPRAIPSLRDKVGVFLCSAEGRRYMLRVPNVAMSRIDDALLAQVMNFVAFDLAGASAPRGSAPFTAAEVHDGKLNVLDTTDLRSAREGILERAEASCRSMAGEGRPAITHEPYR